VTLFRIPHPPAYPTTAATDSLPRGAAWRIRPSSGQAHFNWRNPMTEPLVAPSAANDAAAAVLQVLEGSDRPLTLNQIRDRCAGSKPSPDLLRGVLAEQARHGRVFTCSPLRGVSRFWHGTRNSWGESASWNFSGGGSRSGKELAAKLDVVCPPHSGPGGMRVLLRIG